HLPAGYFDSVLGHNVIVDAHLREYYNHLAFITRGPLLSLRRLGETLLFNLGRYNRLLHDYEETVDRPQKHVDRLEFFVDPGDGPECTRCIVFYNAFDLWTRAPVTGAVNCTVIADRDRGFHLVWMSDDVSLGATDFGPVDGQHQLFKY